MTPWKEKANREIFRMCAESHRHMNQYSDGTWRKRHAPYSVPWLAEELIDCLNKDDEHRAKAAFIKMAAVPQWEND